MGKDIANYRVIFRIFNRRASVGKDISFDDVVIT
jgi:hypothetical protein